MRTVGYQPPAAPKPPKRPATPKPPKPEQPKTDGDKPEAQGDG